MTPTLPLPDAPGLDGPSYWHECPMCEKNSLGSNHRPFCCEKCKAHYEGRTHLCDGCQKWAEPDDVKDHVTEGPRCEPCRCVCLECGEEESMPCIDGICAGCTGKKAMKEALYILRKSDRMSVSDAIRILERGLEAS